MSFRVLLSKRSYFFCISGVVAETGKVYFITSDLALVFNRPHDWILDVSSCQLKHVAPKYQKRSEAWVVEYSALINLLKLENERTVYYLLKFGYVKDVTSGSSKIPLLEECPRKEEGSRLFDSWLEDFKKARTERTS